GRRRLLRSVLGPLYFRRGHPPATAPPLFEIVPCANDADGRTWLCSFRVPSFFARMAGSYGGLRSSTVACLGRARCTLRQADPGVQRKTLRATERGQCRWRRGAFGGNKADRGRCG